MRPATTKNGTTQKAKGVEFKFKNMKTKYYLITIIAFVAIFILFGFSNERESSGEILIMRTSEAWSGNYDNSITIIYEDSKVEKIELMKLEVNDVSQNLKLINENLNKIRSNGYKLVSTAAGGDDRINLTTYIFEKQ